MVYAIVDTHVIYLVLFVTGTFPAVVSFLVAGVTAIRTVAVPVGTEAIQTVSTLRLALCAPRGFRTFYNNMTNTSGTHHKLGYIFVSFISFSVL